MREDLYPHQTGPIESSEAALTIKKPVNIGCILMASGLSVRYGKNKLMEKLGGREIILHTAQNLKEAGLTPLAVTRSREVKALLNREGFICILHEGARKSDTIHVGITNADPQAQGYLFMPGDQPLVLPSSIQNLIKQFCLRPSRAVRLGFGNTAGSPVLFPASLREALLAYTGERGGMEVLQKKQMPCDLVQAAFDWELWDVDTPEKMKQVRGGYLLRLQRRDSEGAADRNGFLYPGIDD